MVYLVLKSVKNRDFQKYYHDTNSGKFLLEHILLQNFKNKREAEWIRQVLWEVNELQSDSVVDAATLMMQVAGQFFVLDVRFDILAIHGQLAAFTGFACDKLMQMQAFNRELQGFEFNLI